MSQASEKLNHCRIFVVRFATFAKGNTKARFENTKARLDPLPPRTAVTYVQTSTVSSETGGASRASVSQPWPNTRVAGCVLLRLLAWPKWAEMAKIKSRPIILILSDLLGDHLMILKKKELFQPGPYPSRYGYRFTAIFKIVVKSRWSGSYISTNTAPIEIILSISGVVRIRRSSYVSEKRIISIGAIFVEIWLPVHRDLWKSRCAGSHISTNINRIETIRVYSESGTHVLKHMKDSIF
jgi:hypothetical protein